MYRPIRTSLPVSHSRPNGDTTEEGDDDDARYFNVVFCKSSTRKHKKFDSDGLLKVRASTRLAVLIEAEGDKKEVCRGSGMGISELRELGTGGSITFGGKDIEVMEEISRDEYQGRNNKEKGNEETTKPQLSERRMNPIAAARSHRPDVLNKAVFKPFSAPARSGVGGPSPAAGFNSPCLSINPRPMFNPVSQDAFVLPRPPFSQQKSRGGETLIDVVVDPYLAKRLRPHQKTGVIFLYQSVMGFNDECGCNGAILADEMGLGKTLQTITLIWTLLKQGPWHGKPVVKRTLILAPSSLVKNWQAEFKKWLGTERINVFAVDQTNRVSEYTKRPTHPVLIMSYEMFVRNFDDINSINFDLVVCDEGHRLKNDKIKASTLLAQMDTDKRIVLTGTPLQNDLKEFYAIVCVVNPNAFGTPATFARQFEDPIVRSKQPEATEEEVETGEMKMEELMQLTSQFILRRTQEIISKYLPPKTEYVLFCRPSPLQTFLYQGILQGIGLNFAMDTGCVLSNIMQLRKVCNHPSFVETDISSIPEEFLKGTYEDQGTKLAVVSFILQELHSRSDEKIVLVSISTQVLDLFEELCQHYSYSFLRLDGSTSQNQRQSVVNRFNSPHGKDLVLLLSSKAGGTGLNLVGASRILLYDMDWNPAHDIQAMARVWRDGQTKPVKVYRLVTTGTIEEKIFQRQVTKQGLGGGVVDQGNGTGASSHKAAKFHFTREELKDLFSFIEDTDCDTHDLLDCCCDGTSNNVVPNSTFGEAVRACQIGGGDPVATPSNSSKSSGGNIKDLLTWQHIQPPIGDLDDQCLASATSLITYAFRNVHTK